MHALRHAVRSLLRQPSLVVVAVITLALGIGGNTAIFTVVDAVLLRPLPFSEPDRVMVVTERTPQLPVLSASWQNYVDWRDQNCSFSTLGAYRHVTVTVTGGDTPERMPAKMVTASLLPMLGVDAELGRRFRASDDQADGAQVAMISHGLWLRRFGGAREVLRRTLTVDNVPRQIIGVLPPAFSLVQPADVFVPLGPWAATLPDDRSWHPGIFPLGRLRPGVSVEQAQAEMDTIARRLYAEYKASNIATGANVTPLHEQMVTNVRPALLLLLAAVGLVLLIACSNVASLLLARTVDRRREIAVRAALGASRLAILRQLLAESLLLSVVGGATGLLLANWAVSALMALAGTSLPGAELVTVDRRVLAFSAALSMLTGVAFGLVPGVHASRVDLREALNEESRGTSAARRTLRVRGLLVVSEVALATVLLIGASLLLRSFARLQAVPPGFATARLLVADLPMSPAGYSRDEQRARFAEEALARINEIPGVRAAGLTTTLPMAGAGTTLHFNIEGKPPRSTEEWIVAGYRAVSADYLRALGVPLLRGRHLTKYDRAGSKPVVVINETMAKRFFGRLDPLGRRLQVGATPDESVPWMEVVGVVGDVRQGFDADAQAEMYVPYLQGVPDPVLGPLFRNVSVVVRTAGDPMAAAGALRRALTTVDRDQPVVKLRTMEAAMGETVAAPRFRTILVTLFAAIALLLAAVGVYGVMGYAVSQRTQEFAIRVALGADSAVVVRMVLLETLRLVATGSVAGIVFGLALSRLLGGLLYETPPADPLALIGAPLVLFAAAVAASWLPARRAVRVDPIAALR